MIDEMPKAEYAFLIENRCTHLLIPIARQGGVYVSDYNRNIG